MDVQHQYIGKGGASLEVVKYKRSKELIRLALQAEKYLRELGNRVLRISVNL